MTDGSLHSRILEITGENRLLMLLVPPFLGESSIAGWANLEFFASFVFSDPSNPESLLVKCRTAHIFWISNGAP